MVGRALAKDNLVPVFNCFCFDGDTVAAYDDHLGIITIADPTNPDMTFAVNGATLLGLLRASQSAEVNFKLNDDHEVVVKAGKSNFKLPYQTKEDFLFKEPDSKWDAKLILGKDNPKGIQACLATSSKDTAHPALMGITFSQKQPNICLYSCDGDAVSRYQLPMKSQQGTNDFMAPNAFWETMLKVLAEKEDATASILTFSKEWALASIGGYAIYGRLIDNPTPLDHEGLIKDTLKEEPFFVSIPEELDHALSRARVVGDPESKPTQLTVAGGKLSLLTDTHLGVVRDVLSFEHPDVVALVSAELMQRSVAVTTEMAIMSNCCVFKQGEHLFTLLMNFG